MNCEDAPMSEWDKLTGAEEEAKEYDFYLDALSDPRN